MDDVGGFKIATGGGWLSAEKKFGDPFQFKKLCKNLLLHVIKFHYLIIWME